MRFMAGIVLFALSPAVIAAPSNFSPRIRVADATADACFASCTSQAESCQRVCPTTLSAPCISSCQSQAQTCRQSCQPR